MCKSNTGPVAKIFQGLIAAYRICFSPNTLPCCRFVPSCSEYAAEAFANLGVFKASYLVLIRILRCNPLCRGGHDPVPGLPKKENT